MFTTRNTYLHPSVYFEIISTRLIHTTEQILHKNLQAKFWIAQFQNNGRVCMQVNRIFQPKPNHKINAK